MSSSSLSPNPMSSSPAAAAAASDRLQRIYLNVETTKELWWAVVSCFIAVLAGVRLVEVFLNISRKTQIPSDPSALVEQEKHEEPARRRGAIALRRVPQAAVTAFRIAAFRWTVPIGLQARMLMADVWVILGYMAGVLVWDLTRTHNLNTKFYEDRSAHIASAQISLVVALAGKNNVISFLTGISHEKLNVVHRAGGCMIVLLLWIHAIGRLYTGIGNFDYFETTWMKAGLVGVTAYTLVALLSLRPIRTVAYEFFFVTHIALTALAIACGIVHRPECQHYFWPGFVVWAFDRTLRLLRLLTINMRWWRRGDKLVKGHVELISPGTVRLTLRRPIAWTPGQHAYLILPSVSTLPSEAHPFTISSIPYPVDGSEAKSKEHNMVFIVRGMNGFTKRLHQHADEKGSGSVTAIVDGCYGYPPDLATYSTSVFIAGGSGVTYTLPLFMNLIRMARLGKSSVRRIVFIWAIRDRDHLRWIGESLLQAVDAAPAHVSLEVKVFVTRAAMETVPGLEYAEEPSQTPPNASNSSISDKQAEKKLSDVETLVTALNVQVGRPDVAQLLRHEIEPALGRVSVNVAGPAPLARAVREALASDIAGPVGVLKGAPTVNLHIETFGVVGA